MCIRDRTKKVPRNHVKAEATDRHPAQVEVYTEDVVVGNWERLMFSGEVSAKERKEMLERVSVLSDAVKFAREEANQTEVTQRNIGDNIFGYVFG